MNHHHKSPSPPQIRMTIGGVWLSDPNHQHISRIAFFCGLRHEPAGSQEQLVSQNMQTFKKEPKNCPQKGLRSFVCPESSEVVHEFSLLAVKLMLSHFNHTGHGRCAFASLLSWATQLSHESWIPSPQCAHDRTCRI